MARRNAEVLKGAFEAFSRGDIEGAMTFLHPEIEWHGFAETPGQGGRVYRGHDGLREVAEDWSVWDDFALEVEEAIPVSDDQVCS